jgi:hypothetical protein
LYKEYHANNIHDCHLRESKKMVVKSRTQLLREFEEASVNALFTQITVAAILDRSVASIERDRGRGTGIPFRRIGHSIRYSKRDILAWLSQYRAVRSTADADAQAMRLREVCHE